MSDGNQLQAGNFDKQKFADHLNANISPKQFGEGACAKHVRLALQASGLKLITWPIPAKDWGSSLLALGFREVPKSGYIPELGDVVVIQPPSKDAKQYGHIQGYDGKAWVSDFVQTNGFWPGPSYRQEQPSYAIYRYSRQYADIGFLVFFCSRSRSAGADRSGIRIES